MQKYQFELQTLLANYQMIIICKNYMHEFITLEKYRVKSKLETKFFNRQDKTEPQELKRIPKTYCKGCTLSNDRR